MNYYVKKESLEKACKYLPLLRQLVIRDIKLKYRRSILGYAWSVLNPLMTMAIMVFVFSYLFKSNIEHYPAYLLSGQLLFSFFTESSSQAISSITDNSSLIKKTNVPKYVFTIAKVSSCLVNTFFNLCALFIVMIFTKVKFSFAMLLIPAVLIEVYVFNLGVGLLLAEFCVFFRDIQHIWKALLTTLSYATPIFYPMSLLPKRAQNILILCNPLVSYVIQLRSLILDGKIPQLQFTMYGIVCSLLALITGVVFFNKKQDDFIIYI